MPGTRSNKTQLAATTAALAMGASAVLAAPSAFYSLTGDGVFEAFDSMGTSGTSAPENAWELFVAGDPDQATLGVGPSWPSNTGFNGGPWAGAGFTDPVSDRALGVYAGATGDQRTITMGVRNDTGADLDQLHLVYDVEKWIQRVAGRSGGFQVRFSLDGSSWTSLGSEFRTVLSTDGALVTDYWVNGNELAARGVGGTFATPQSIADGETFLLQWDGRGIGASQNKNVGVFLDNVWLAPDADTPVPVPAGGPVVLSVAGIAVLIPPSRRRSTG